MRFSWLRALPALFVAALLTLVLLAPSRGARARGAAGLDAYYYPRCDMLLQSGGWDDSVAFLPGGGVTQPIASAGNIAACSLSIERPVYNYAENGRMDVVLWNPATLAPDPTTVALRTLTFLNSQMVQNHARADFNPPLVTRNLPQLADPRSGPLAMNYQGADPGTPHKAAYMTSGDPGTPIAYGYPPGGARAPLPGAHPVLSHAICGGDAGLQELYVAQCVMTTDFLMTYPPYELCQSFRVPSAVEVRWVELALGANAGGGYGLIAIVDAQGATTPPSSLPQALVDGTFSAPYPLIPQWISHYDFDRTTILQPHHDYFLIVRAPTTYSFYTRTYTGSESNEYFAAVGGLFGRPMPTGTWYPYNGRSLSFRLIGRPVGALDAPPPAPPARGELRLRITPNPSRGTSFVTWSGARGVLRFEVLDERGRRIAEGRGEPGVDGRWLWQAAGADGRTLPAGVYFVRARDDAGHEAVERVVLVR